ncbi:MAG TPA: VIT and VWA domain-containing protein [Gammaproteobacteria bacterium]
MNIFTQCLKQYYLAASLLFIAVISCSTQAAGLLTPAQNGSQPLSIRQHHVNVVIEDGYAITRVEQVFYNPYAQDLEANYSFPIPEQAAVAEFTVWIDGQPVAGEVLERQEARRVYEEEKQAGREAGLTEKNSYKTFEIFVTPVRAQQETKIKLVYIQPAQVDTGIGRFVYPLEEGGTDEAKQNFWANNAQVEDVFSFKLVVKSTYPIQAVRVPNQSLAQVSQNQQGGWLVTLAAQNGVIVNEENAAGNSANQTARTTPAFKLDKDIVVYWKHAEGLPGSVDLTAYKPQADGRGTFMLTLTPGDDLALIQEGSDWIFVLDISGSMRGKYASLAEGVQRALKKMRVNDRFRIVTFNDTARELTNGYVYATQENVDRYANAVAAVSPDKGTNLYAGLKIGIDSIEAERTTGIILVTDGVANVGESHERRFLELIKQKDIRLFTFIMGNSANRPLLEMLAKASGGFALNVSNSDDIVGQILLASGKLTHAAMHDVKLNITGVKTSDLSPRNIGSLYRGQQLVVFGHYWGEGLAEVTLETRISGSPKTYQTQFAFSALAVENPELERLWAFAMVNDIQQEMSDFGEKADLKQAAADIAKQYGLVTDYTSMVVMREDVFAQRNIARANQQRVQAEHTAQTQRAQRPATERRADTRQPMFSGSRASTGGGGAMNLWALLPLLVMVLVRRKLTT